jgi:hypothetical protein
MEKKSGTVFIIIVIVLVIAGLILAIMPSDRAAEECLRGNNSACVYFQAQERVDKAKQELQAARAVLATAKAEYQESISTKTEESTNQ